MRLAAGAGAAHQPFSRPRRNGLAVRAATVVLAVAVAFLAVAGAVAAQTPSASPSVTITPAAGNGSTVSVEKASSFKFTVKNTSPGGGTPVGDGDMADVAIRVSGVPDDGWTASVDTPNFQLASGASKDITVQVAVATASATAAATLTVTADLSSPLKGADPVLGNVPGAAQKASASTTLALSLHDSLTRTVIETVGPWIYAVLLLLVVAVLVAVAITVSSRRTLVRLSADTRELPVPPGGKVAFPFRAEGLARETDSVLLQVSAVQEGWAAFLPVPELALDPGQAQDLTLVVIAPRNAAQGTRQAILVTATSGKAPKGAANLEFVARVEGPEDLPAARRPKAA